MTKTSARKQPETLAMTPEIGSSYPAAELEEVHDGAGNMYLWIARYESTRFMFTALGQSNYCAFTALTDGLRAHAVQYSIDPHWFYPEDIHVQRVKVGSTLRDGEVLNG